jgi:[protein-PII] uridylyltransferase
MSERPSGALAQASGDGSLDGYVASMPRAYRQLFNDDAIAAHAGVVHRRGPSAVHVEIWRELPGNVAAICVVADDDAGLLARISAALLADDFDVVAAQAYCRTRADGRVEAVDLFWVRRLSRATGAAIPVRARDVAILGGTLDALVRSRVDFERQLRERPAPRPAGEATRVRFDADERDGGMVLTIQGPDRPGLLFLITDALFREGARIARSDVTTHEGQALDRFHLTEHDGSALRRARLLGIQTAVLDAVE